MSEKKELNFFNSSPKTVREKLPDYEANFRGSEEATIRGESTPHYFWKKDPDSAFSPPLTSPIDAATNLRSIVDDDAKIIVVLRDPTSRAISAYHHHYAMGRNDHIKTIFACDTSWGLVDLGLYRRHMKHWSSIFGSQVRYYLYDDLRDSPHELIANILDWLDLPPSDAIDARIAANRKVNSRENILRRNKELGDDFPTLTTQEVAALSAIFTPHVRYVESVLERPLNDWLDVETLVERNRGWVR